MKSTYRRTKLDGRAIDVHRLTVEKIIGRKLGRWEFVHHINGDKQDNRVENLEIVTPVEHAARHHQWKHPRIKTCQVCGKKYEPKPTKRAASKTCSQKCRYILLSNMNRNPSAPHSMYRKNACPCQVANRKPEVAAAFIEASEDALA